MTAAVTPGASEPSPDAPTSLVDLGGRSPWSILPALLAGFFMIMLDTTIVNIAVPSLVSSFGADLVAVGWVNSGYLLSYAILLLVSGRLGDRYGPRPVFIVGLTVFTLSSWACGMAPTIGWLIAARVVQGIGGALVAPQTMTLITRVFPERQRGTALGLWGTIAGVAAIAGPLLGGVLVETVGWQWIFFVNLPVGAVALWLAFRRLPVLSTQARSLDLVGVVLSVVGLFLVVFGLQEGATYDWGTIAGPITVWGVIGAGVLVLAVFGVIQTRRGDDALLPMRLFRRRNFLLGNVAGAAVTFAMIGIYFPIMLYLQEILGLSAIHAALVDLPGSVVSAAVAPFVGRLSDRLPGKWIVVTGFGSMAVAVGWLAGWTDVERTAWHLVFPLALFALGVTAVMSPLSNLVSVGLEASTAGAASGAYNMTRQVGGVIGSAAIVVMLSARAAVAIPEAARSLAEGLSVQGREVFLQALATGGLSHGTSGDVTLPDGTPASVVAEVQAAAVQAVHTGFATATAQTMLLACAVVVVGLLASVLMAASPAPAPAPAG
ncbi:MAG: DHA2 family efflux MFS transporter permease subunit [Cellulomonas sp.]|nr:DHA2 family efflux MFS transporter permease subunit [Cellulomonas sp.]